LACSGNDNPTVRPVDSTAGTTERPAPGSTEADNAPGAVDTTEAPTSSDTEPDAPTNEGTPGADGLGDSIYPTYGNGGYDVIAYDIDLTFDPASGVIDATTTVRAVATQDLSSFNLDLDGLEVTAITIDGDATTFTRDGAELVVTPADGIATGDEFSTAVTYNGEPGQSDFGGWLDDTNGGIVAFGQPEVSAFWYPVNDHPLDKAGYRITVTTDSSLGVFSNGTRIDQQVNGAETTWVYEQVEPQASYLTTLVIGDYTEVEADPSASGVRIRNVFPTDRVDELTKAFDQQDEMIDAFEQVFGPYPFDVYGSLVLHGPDLGAALENQTLSVYAPSAISENIQAHELAHQWFGDAVSISDWSDIWLNEGFATYSELLWEEANDPEFNITEVLTANRFPELDQPITDVGPGLYDLFTISVYVRGAMLLHALRLEVGDEVFFDIVNSHAVENDNGNATTDQFIALCEETSGQQLDDLFDEWLNSPTLPEF
jgi:aminopeptidase N